MQTLENIHCFFLQSVTDFSFHLADVIARSYLHIFIAALLYRYISEQLHCWPKQIALCSLFFVGFSFAVSHAAHIFSFFGWNLFGLVWFCSFRSQEFCKAAIFILVKQWSVSKEIHKQRELIATNFSCLLNYYYFCCVLFFLVVHANMEFPLRVLFVVA